MLTSALLPNYPLAEQVSFNDESIKATYQSFNSSTGHSKGQGYLGKDDEGRAMPRSMYQDTNHGFRNDATSL